MGKKEVKYYFEDKYFIFQLLHTYVDYDDIDDPVKTIPGKLWTLKLRDGISRNLEPTMQSHIFTDNKSLLQMVSSGTET